MLINLKVNNIALIDTLDINFKNGLTVLTGETGAGKSIIIDAINFVLGERADKSLIRTGQNFAKVDAVFYLYQTDATASVFDELGLEFDNTIILSRTMSVEGRNECRVNGQIVTVGMLKQISSTLMDIHGQQEHQTVMSAKNHITILDLYAGTKIHTYKKSISELLTQLSELNNQIKQLGGNNDDRQNRLDYLSYQIQQLEKSNLKSGEEQELAEKLKVLNSTEKIKSALNECVQLLQGNAFNISNSLNQCERQVLSISNFKNEYEQIRAELAGELNLMQTSYRDENGYIVTETKQENGEDGFSLENILSDTETEDVMLERISLQQAIESLPEREALVIRMRYYHGLTQQRIAKVLNVSQVQVSRIEKKALLQLKTYMR